MKEKIIARSGELFLKYGVRSVTMDDIARELGVSKKTLYQYVDNKKDLVNQVLLQHLENEKVAMEALQQTSKNAIDEMIAIGRYVRQLLLQVNPSAIYDLQKYYHESWSFVKQTNDQAIYTILTKNMEKGIKEGLYRNDINVDVIAKFYVGRADLLLDTDLFPITKYNRTQLHQEFIHYHLRAIASEEGAKLLEKYQQQPQR